MTLVDYTVDDTVAIVTMKNGENRFNPDFLNLLLNTLDDIEQNTDARNLVITSAHEKIFSNGIDLEWLVPVIQKKDAAAAKNFFYLLNRLFKRTLTYPLVTVAAISGHAFAGGAIWSCAFDFRFMRTGRGFFCLPEVDLGIPFLPGMLGLLKKAIPHHLLEEMHHLGTRLTAEECEAGHIITRACPQETLLADAVAFAKPHAKKRNILGEMKSRYYQEIIHAIDIEDVPYIESGKFNIG